MIRRLFGLALFLAAFVSLAAEAPLTIGVLTHRPTEVVTARWQPLTVYLSRALGGREVRLKPAGYAELTELLDRQAIDFALTNPSHFIALRQRNPLTGALATMIVHDGDHSVNAYGGAIIVRRERADIRRLADLSDKRIVAVAPSSLGGYLAQRKELHEKGIALPRALHFVGEPQDKVVEAVLRGEADAGFVRSGVIEAMSRSGLLDGERLRVINAQNLPGFPHAVSTRLYPEWPFFALPHVEEDVVRRVTAALLLLADDPVFRSTLDRRGFGVAADCLPVENLLRSLCVCRPSKRRRRSHSPTSGCVTSPCW